jgi:hypothetical protein
MGSSDGAGVFLRKLSRRTLAVKANCVLCGVNRGISAYETLPTFTLALFGDAGAPVLMHPLQIRTTRGNVLA